MREKQRGMIYIHIYYTFSIIELFPLPVRLYMLLLRAKLIATLKGVYKVNSCLCLTYSYLRKIVVKDLSNLICLILNIN